ncbi:uncharacterized protein CIMG_13319 [Coccidioides immitis RS]|uniref:Uncharacterized protein n=1 Tax=Coccidioides immitis (strain RS) TaxID=246410 RepID=A0A0D8JXB5_COCIM|nr:uncharacterized protein CIMG_13319 [Coccidioides immitis RS]KJF60918.1 hypothetical protein CIMG_13319 [Coccidioides immitis RS]
MHCHLLCIISSSHSPPVPSQLGWIEESSPQQNCDGGCVPWLDQVGLHVLITSSGIVEWISVGDGMGWVCLTRCFFGCIGSVPFLPPGGGLSEGWELLHMPCSI